MPLSERDYYRQGMREKQPNYAVTRINAQGDLERIDPETVLVAQPDGSYLIVHNGRTLGRIDLPPRRVFVKKHMRGRLILALLIGALAGSLSTLWGVTTGHVLPDPAGGAPHFCWARPCARWTIAPDTISSGSGTLPPPRAALSYAPSRRSPLRRSIPLHVGANRELGWRPIAHPHTADVPLQMLRTDEIKQSSGFAARPRSTTR